MPEKESLPSNSMVSKKSAAKPNTTKLSAEKKRKQIIQQPIKRKKSVVEKELTEVKSFMIDDIVLPRVRDMIMEIIGGIFGMAEDAIESAIFGGSSRPRWNSGYSHKSHGHGRGSHVPYNSIYDRGRSMRKRGIAYDEEEDYIQDYRDVIIKDLDERDAIEEEMMDVIEDQGYLSVGDLNYIMGIKVGDYTDEDYGWKNLNGMRFKAIRGGRYKLEMPKPRPI